MSDIANSTNPRLLHLHCVNFRNLATFDASFSPSANIFTGANGSGKTNLLEAICVLCLGRSQRLNATDSALIRAGADYYRLNGEGICEGREIALSVAYQEGIGKKATVDTAPVRLSELFRHFAVVWMSPEDSDLISAGPESRRKYLDLHLSQAGIFYLDTLSQYQKTLAQRNSHLKNYGIDAAGTPFDEQLLEYGSRLTKFRADFLERAGKIAAERYRVIAPRGGELSLAYEPSALVSQSARKLGSQSENSNELSESQIREKFQERLSSRFAAEAERQVTLVGPHRDDFEIRIGSLPARTHGSQGEWRTAAVALKLAVYEYIVERTGRAPLLLLDEVFAELDVKRQEALGSLFQNCGQVFLTTALAPPEFLGSRANVFYVNDGVVAAA